LPRVRTKQTATRKEDDVGFRKQGKELRGGGDWVAATKGKKLLTGSGGGGPFGERGETSWGGGQKKSVSISCRGANHDSRAGPHSSTHMGG